MANDALAQLRAGGNAADALSDSERAVLAHLSAEEVAALNSVRASVAVASGAAAGSGDVVVGAFIF